MSGYRKNHEYVYDAEATRSNQVASYPGIAQPAFASQYTHAPALLGHEPTSAEMPYIPSSANESRGTEDVQSNPSFIDAGARHPASLAVAETEITEKITPAQGTAGSLVTLQLRTNYDLDANLHTFILMFGHKKCVAILQKVDYEDDDPWYNYVLNVEVPPFPLTNTFDLTMMLKLQMEDKMGNLGSQTDAGKFTYTDMSPNLAYQSSPDFSRKRKYSPEFGNSQEFSNGNLAKRAFAKPRTMSRAYSAAQMSPLPTQSAIANTYAQASRYRLAKQPNYSSQISQKGLYAVPSGMGMGHGEYKLPQMSPMLHSYNLCNSLPSTSRNNVASVLPSPSALSTPVLVRATHFAQASGSASSPQSFNPYSIGQGKAILKIEGDLDKMADGWSQEELEAKRRLVGFERSQVGSTITTTFGPTITEARDARRICVSCIWWEEKGECFITSVDTISLLEQLVNVRFTVEEKNRIRRNLEGFRPLTVSKTRPDSEGFFKVIMGFPNPKPRNIEKDVKVFPWKILAHALKKIISKYTASYASTAGVGHLPIATTSYAPRADSQAALDAHRNTSPQSVPASTPPTAYTRNLTSSSLSPHQKVAAGLEASAGQCRPVTQRTPPGRGMDPWGTSTHQMSQYPSTLAHGGRGSWDYEYLSVSAATEVPPIPHALQMPRQTAAPDLSHMPATHTYHQYAEDTTRV